MQKDYAVLIAATESKLQEPLQNIEKQTAEDEININCKKAVCKAVSKRNILICYVQIVDNKINKVQPFKYIACLLLAKRK